MTVTEEAPTDEIVDSGLFGAPDVEPKEIPDEPSVPGDPLHCDECNKDFKNEHGRAIHDSRMHGISPNKDKSPTRPRKSSKTDLTPALMQMFMLIAMTAQMVNPADGMVIGQNAESMANAWAALAEESPAVDKALRTLVTGSAFGGVVIATLPVVVGLMGNHGLLPGSVNAMMGTQREGVND